MKKQRWVDIFSSLLILLFVYAAVSKLLDFNNFSRMLHTIPIVGNNSKIAAFLLPTIEIIISIFLFFPNIRRIGLWASLAIMIMFTGYIGYMLYFSKHTPCTCGGILQKMTWTQHFYFNIFFTLLAAFGLFLSRNKITQNANPSKLKFRPTT